jgi:hypothetical protein
LLGGSAALAAKHLGRNTVGQNQLKKKSVATAKLKNNAVTTGKIAAGAVTNEKLADNAVTLTKIADSSINSAKVLDGSLSGKDVAANSLTGANINESTLGPVPDAAKLGGKNESAVEAGQTLGDNTQVISEACNPGDILLSGGPANIAPTTTLLESFPSPGSTNSWTARVNKNAQTDNFSVVVLCAKQG